MARYILFCGESAVKSNQSVVMPLCCFSVHGSLEHHAAKHLHGPPDFCARCTLRDTWRQFSSVRRRRWHANSWCEFCRRIAGVVDTSRKQSGYRSVAASAVTHCSAGQGRPSPKDHDATSPSRLPPFAPPPFLSGFGGKILELVSE